MNSRFRQPTSLEMLLDTMCNAFGGIILIALLISLITREVRRTELQAQDVAQSTSLLSQRVTHAEQDLAEAMAYRESLENRRSNPDLAERAALTEERETLRHRIEELEAERAAMAQNLVSAADRAATNLHQQLEALQVEHDALHREWVEERNQHEVLQMAREELRRTVSTTESQLRRNQQNQTRRLRLPREHDTLKRPWHIIVRYSRLYPVNYMIAGVRERNTTTIQWQPGPNGEEMALPLPGRGLDPATPGGALTAALANVPPDEFYVVYHVYEDSFEAFIEARETPLRLGFEMTWVPLENHISLVIRPGDDEPPPRPL